MPSRTEEIRRPHHVIATTGEIGAARRALAKEMMDS